MKYLGRNKALIGCAAEPTQLHANPAVSVQGSSFLAIFLRFCTVATSRNSSRALSSRTSADLALFQRRGRHDEPPVLSSNCKNCALKGRCTPSQQRRVARWEHQDVLDDMQTRLENSPEAMCIRRSSVEHPYGTIKAWMGATHFLTKGLERVRGEMSLHVLAYNFRRLLTLLGMTAMLSAIRAYARFFALFGRLWDCVLQAARKMTCRAIANRELFTCPHIRRLRKITAELLTSCFYTAWAQCGPRPMCSVLTWLCDMQKKLLDGYFRARKFALQATS